ncbi:MAG: SDR family oxidoreductase, partial [Planctomycetota bacterium]
AGYTSVLCDALARANDAFRTSVQRSLRIEDEHSNGLTKSKNDHKRNKMMGKLNGKVAVITGASSGIGEATARRLSESGAHVVLVARREEKLNALAAFIQKAGGHATVVVGDVSTFPGAEQVFRDTIEATGKLDIVVNNAGIMNLDRVTDADPNEWQRMIQINLLGLMYCSQLALQKMAEQGSGQIVNIASNLGRAVMPGAAAYSASKAGVIAFSETMRREAIAVNVRVTVVEPGATQTEMHGHITNPELRERTKAFAEQIDAMAPEDIANAVDYALSQPEGVNVSEILVRPSKQEI